MEWSCEVQSNFAALRIFTPLVETNENDASDEPPHILFHSAPFLNELPSSQSSNFLPKCLKWWKIPSKLDQTVCLRTAPKGTLLLTGGYFSLHVRNILSLRPRKEANSSSAAGIPALSEAIATAGTLGKVVVFSPPPPPVLKLMTTDISEHSPSHSKIVVDNVDLTSSLKFPWIYQIT